MSKRLAFLLGLVLFSSISAFSAPARAVFQVPTVGWEGQGAGMAFTNLDANPKPELILMAVDNPTGMNSFRFRIGWNLDGTGRATSWSSERQVTGVGNEAQGAGVAVANLDQDGRPELILMAYDNPPSGQNTFRYKIGWNLNTSGYATSWSSQIEIPVGYFESQGASIVVTNLNNNKRPDMILMLYENPGNQNDNSFVYKIGWDLDENGRAASWLRTFYRIPGVGWEGQGAGMAVFNLDANPRPEMILMAYDNPNGANSFRYKIGSNLDTAGGTPSWSPFYPVADIGWEGQGADLGVFNLDGNAKPELVFMSYDNPSGANSFRYRVVSNVVASTNLSIEFDRLAGVDWLPTSVTRNVRTHTLESIFAAAGITVRTQNDDTVDDLRNGQPYRDADLLAFRDANRDTNATHGALLTTHADPLWGVMYDVTDRQGFAVFVEEIGDPSYVLRNAVHEFGHTLCLGHAHGDAWRAGGAMAGQGHTFMDTVSTLASNWDFGWSASALHHFFHIPVSQWQPGNGLGYGSCDSLTFSPIN